MSVKYFDKTQNKWVIFPGSIGAPGRSAYELAVQQGYKGTLDEWLLSLKGKDAYTIAVEGGYKGTEEEFNNALTTAPIAVETINNSITTINNNTLRINNITTNGSITPEVLKIQKNGVDLLDPWNGSKEGVANIVVPTSLSELNPTEQDIIDALGYRPADAAQAGMGDITGPSSSIDSNIVLFSGTNGKTIKDSNYNVGSFAVKNHTHTVSQITDFPEIPEAITVDSALSTTSENPVQNKVITTQLNNKVNNATLNGYATESWVTNQGYSTENTWRPVKVGSTTLSDSSTTLTIANGTGIGLTLANGTLTITNSAPGSSYTLPVAKDNILGGIKTGYTESGGAEMAIYTLEDGTAYTLLRDTAVKTALGFTPANVNDIPIALPNPYALNITAGGSSTNYTGSATANLNLDKVFSKKLATVTTPGQPGIFVGTAASYEVSSLYVSENNPDAIIVIPASSSISFNNTIYTEMKDLGSLTGGTYKCYCITYINSSIVLVNGAVYGYDATN